LAFPRVSEKDIIMASDFLAALRPSVVMTGLFALTLGLAYPAAVTGAAQLLFAHQANGSLIRRDGQVVGSALLAQGFAAPAISTRALGGRPAGYDASASAGSNLGPGSQALAERIAKDRAGLGGGAVPADLLTTSASGLDPDISPEAALFQADRVAAARHWRPSACAPWCRPPSSRRCWACWAAARERAAAEPGAGRRRAVNEPRPDPDALLRSLAQQEGKQGRLKVFLGAAPGVGKTYEMLMQAAARRDAGEDVVVGVIETHGRAETEARSRVRDDPRRAIAHRGQVLHEMDSTRSRAPPRWC
jgi:K+-transporting ATPase ATPase C chain